MQSLDVVAALHGKGTISYNYTTTTHNLKLQQDCGGHFVSLKKVTLGLAREKQVSQLKS